MRDVAIPAFAGAGQDAAPDLTRLDHTPHDLPPAGMSLEEYRAELFRETWRRRLKRWAFGTIYALMPQRARNVPPLLLNAGLDLMRGGTSVPSPQRTSLPDTFGGVCRNASAETVLAAARLGFYPWSHVGPLKWWCRQQRMVLFLNELHIARRLRRQIRKADYRVTFDQSFEEVIIRCAGRRSYNRHDLTWITPQIMRIYADLFDQGHAHSFEVWHKDGRLVGGGYGLSVGGVFMTESQFSHEPNTSKIGFTVLNYHLAKWGYALNDGKDWTPTIDAMGFRKIPAEEFRTILAGQGTPGEFGGKVGRWSVEADLATVAAWEPAGKAKPLAEAAE